MLIEVLVSMLLLAFALLALVSSKANAIKHAGDAQLRTEASYLANQIIGQMWVDRANLAGYAHMTTTAGTCNFAGAASALAEVTNWLGNSSTKGTVVGTLPNSVVQILANGGTGEVTVTVCWRAPQEVEVHSFTTTTMIAG